MKNNNNPLYVTEWMLPSLDVVGGGNPTPSNAVNAGISYSMGIGSKWLKDQRLVKKIQAKYPQPQDLAQAVSKINTLPAHQFAAKLSNCNDPKEYSLLIKKYICHGTFGRYVIHALFGTTALLGNAVDAGKNEMDDLDTTIVKNLT